MKNSPRRAAFCRASICPIDKSIKLQAPSSKRATICRIDTRCRGASICHIDRSSKQQASSPKQQASSFKPSLASSLIREPRYMDIGKVFDALGPRAWAMMKVLCGCFTWNAIWCGEKVTLLVLVYFNSTVKKTPELLYPNRSGVPGTLRFSILIQDIDVIFFLICA